MENNIIANVCFNRDKDTLEFGDSDRIVQLADEDTGLYFTFYLGRASDDTITLTFNRRELLEKLLEI